MSKCVSPAKRSTCGSGEERPTGCRPGSLSCGGISPGLVKCYIKNEFYIENKGVIREAWIAACTSAPTLEDAIRIAASAHLCMLNSRRTCGKHCKHPHQKYIQNSILSGFAGELLKKKNVSLIAEAADFDSLYAVIADAAIEGIGNLAIYDTALRLGFRLNIYPKKIFLHSGAKEGAKKLGFELRPGSFTAPSGKTYQHPYLDKGDLSPPSAVSTLPEYELENILCVCKECI